MNPSAQPPVTIEELEKRCLGDIDFVLTVLHDFLDRSEPMFDQIENELEQGATSSAARLVHRLKGAALTVAANPLVESLKQYEQVLKGDEVPATPELVTLLTESRQQFEAVRHHVHNQLCQQ